MGESGLVSPAEDEALPQAHLLRPRRGESRTRRASDENPTHHSSPSHLLLPLPAYAANYAGRWTLDRAQSKDLPPFYDEVQTHSMQIEQTDEQLILAVEITSESREPAHFDFTYTLDGAPVKTETQVRTPAGMKSVPTTLTAKPADNGDLDITIERELPTRGGEPLKGTTIEKWRLQKDGRTLVIDRVVKCAAAR